MYGFDWWTASIYNKKIKKSLCIRAGMPSIFPFWVHDSTSQTAACISTEIVVRDQRSHRKKWGTGKITYNTPDEKYDI
jgi:hypothetical protein